jgi:hypothetical protein
MKWGCALAGLMVGAMPAVAWAQEQATTPAPQGAPAGQAEPPADDLEEPIEEVVISGQLEGAVPGDIKPEVQLTPAEIGSFGASNVGELLGQLSAQLGSGSGRGDEQPVILLSGRRASMAEIRSLPPEAIERIDILPEEAALQFGYSATQKVINFVLRRRFMALTTELEGRMPTAGGNAGVNAEAGLTMIRRNQQTRLNVEYDQSSGILESERGVSRVGTSLFDFAGNLTGLTGGEIDPALSAAAGGIVTEAGVPASAAGGAPSLGDFVSTASQPNVTDITPYRTLVNPRKNLKIEGVFRRPLSSKVQAAATVELEGMESHSLQGLSGVTLRLPEGNPYSPFSQDVALLRYIEGQPALVRANSSKRAEAGLTINGDSAPWAQSWRWSFQGNYALNTTESSGDNGIDPSAMQALLDAGDPSFNPFAPIAPGVIRSRPYDNASSRSTTGRVDLLTNGPLFNLPAGDVRASIRASGQTQDFSSESFRRGLASEADIARDRGGVRGTISVPITSDRREVLGFLGDLSADASVEVEELSDFGQLTSTTYGVNWEPVKGIRALVSWTRDSNAPSPQQLGDPLLITPNVPVYDYVRGESANVSVITGGNPALLADDRNVFKANLTLRPLSETMLTITADYTNQRYRDTFGPLPAASAEVEDAFPGRFIRDAEGRLLSIDQRLVNFDRADRSQLKWGFNLFLPIASPAAKRMQERRTAFQAAMAESRRTGQPLPPEFQAQLDQFRRLGQQQSLFGGNPRQGPGQGQGQGQGQGPRPPQGEGAGQAQGAGQERGPGGGPGGRRFGPGGGGGGGRGRFGGNGIQLAAYHTWVFKDENVIRPGLPVLDYLDGAAKGRNGGTPAHRIEFQSGIQRDGFRLRLDGSWQSGSEVATGTPGSMGRLTYGSLAKVNLVAQADLGQQLDLLLKHPWLRGTRVSFRIDNLFDARQRVTDETGATPSAYAPDLMDPLGRLVRLSIRKQFF